MSVKSLIERNGGYLAVSIAVITFLAARKLLSGQEEQAKANIAYAYDAAATATSSSNIDDLKNQVLKYLYAGALNPANVIDNVEAIKSELNNYTTKLTNLASQVASGIVPQSTVSYYLKTIAQDIATKLHIEITPANTSTNGNTDSDWWRRRYGGGGYGGMNNVDYQNYLQQYLQYLQQMQQLYQGQYGYPSYGYSYGYGYQQPSMQPQYPIQNYNYYPQYQQQYPQYSQTPGYGYPQSPYNYGGYQQQQNFADPSIYGSYGGGSIYNNYY